MSPEPTIADLSTHDLETFLQKLTSGRLVTPLSSAGLQAVGLGHLKAYLGLFQALDARALVTIIEALLQERTAHQKQLIDLVWTGPEGGASTTRDTGVVLQELLAQAKHHVLIAGFRFDNGRELFASAHQNMVQHHTQMQIFLDIPRAKAGHDITTAAREYVQEFTLRNWPFGTPYPNFYFDPRTVAVDSTASLHAKCVVVDNQITLIGSANFTDRGQTRNIEIGVLIEDKQFATRVSSQWQGLIGAGLVRQIYG